MQLRLVSEKGQGGRARLALVALLAWAGRSGRTWPAACGRSVQAASPFNVESVITLLISKATVSSGSGAAPLRVAVAAAIAIACKRCGAGHGRGPARLMAPSHRAVPSSIIIILDGCTLWSVPCVGAASVATAPNDLLFWQSLGGCGYRGVKLIRCLLLRACDLTRLLALTDALVPHSFQIFICQQSVLSSMPVLLPLFLHPFLVHLRTG